MTHKSNQGTFSNPIKNNENIKNLEEIQGNKRKYKIKKKFSKHRNSRFECLPFQVVNRSHVYEEVARVISAPLVPTVPTILPVTTMTTIFPHYSEPPLGYTVAMHDWNVMTTAHVHSPVLSIPYPMPMSVYNTAPILTPPLCPYTAAIITPTIVQPVISQPLPMYIEEIPMTTNCECGRLHQFSPEQIVPGLDMDSESPRSTEYDHLYDTSSEESSLPKDPVECFLTLPKDMFPRATMLDLDPNPMIDQLCKFFNLHSNLSWLLDLEFGIPKAPITRPIPIYDVKYNSIHCKNAPDAIHPGFESCSEEFKEALLFYYDCIISSWYRGFVTVCCDMSVEHFQECLLLLMQVLGMCWA